MPKANVLGCRRCSDLSKGFVVVEGKRSDAAVIRSVIGKVLDVVIELDDVEGLAPRTNAFNLQRRRQLVLVSNVCRQETVRVMPIKL
jgi:hypothetical protein